MRYFSETITGDQIDEIDLDYGSLTIENNILTAKFISQENKKTYLDKITSLFEDEEGAWHLFDNRTSTETDVTDQYEDGVIEGHIPNDWDKNKEHDYLEPVGIYHEYTEEEQEEYDAKVAAEQAKHQRELDKTTYYDNLYTNHAALDNLLADLEDEDVLAGSFKQWFDQVNASLTELGDAILEAALNKNGSFEALCHIYARRIKAGQITINDVPERIRERVQEILDQENKPKKKAKKK